MPRKSVYRAPKVETVSPAPLAEQQGDAAVPPHRPPYSPDTVTVDTPEASVTEEAMTDTPPVTTDPITITPAGPDHVGLDLLGAGAQVLQHAVDDLADHGIDAEIPLPKIVAVGDQSAGKSSLIEGISGIRVPRDAGTCTRCPLQIKLSNRGPDATWSCKVSLIKKYDFSGTQSSPAINVDGSAHPFYPWVEKDEPTIIDFGHVYNLKELENVIRIAQFAILNPRRDPRSFIGRTNIDSMTIDTEFSPNLVSLAIYGPNLPNLTFYDLPGVISQSATPGDWHSVKLIKNLVRHYVQQANTLVLVALPMDTEPETSTASGLLREGDDGQHVKDVLDRCIGVVTKPDRHNGQDTANWRAVLSGTRFPFGHGYYVTKQPSQEQLHQGMTNSEAREREAEFFSSSEWKSRFPGFEEKLGTKKLQAALSEKLAHLSFNCLPSIEIQIVDKLQDIETQLKSYPDPPPNCLYEVNSVIGNFERRLAQYLEDDPSFKTLWRTWRKVNEDFKEAVLSLKPAMLVAPQPWTKQTRAGTTSTKMAPMTPQIFSTPSKRPKAAEYIEIDSNSGSDCTTAAATPRTPAKKPKLASGDTLQSPAQGTPLAVRGKGIDFSAQRTKFNLPELQNELDDHCASGLPGDTDRRAVDKLILSTLQHWETLTFQLLNGIAHELKLTLQRTLKDISDKYRSTELYREIESIMIRDLADRIEGQRFSTLAYLLRMEMRKPLTKNRDDLARIQKEEYEYLVDKRWDQRIKEYFNQQAEITGREISATERARGKTDEKIRKKLGEEPYIREIEAISRIRAYYTVAANRFVDNVCQAIEHELFTGFLDSETGVIKKLKAHLQPPDVDPQEHAGRLLEDNPERAARRAQLKTQRARLQQAQARLEKLRHDFFAEQ